ncbi:MAG TPA: ABC transporter permease [Halococcus sp.]|nr:ABC transporter permease [Halococcus sp.]
MGMKWYVVRRLAWAVVVTWIVLSLVFGGLMLSPNPNIQRATMRCGMQTGDVQQCRQDIRQQHGLDKPITERYVDYVLNMYVGNWGFSQTRNQPVWDAITTAWPYSAQFVIPAAVIAAILGYVIALYSAFNQYTKTDYAGSLVAYTGISLPEFWFAIVLVIVFSVGLGWLPVYYDSTIPQRFGWFSWQNIEQLILPTFTVFVTLIAGQMRFARAQTLEYVNAEFMKVAKAKGASQYRLMIRHALRVALVPLSTFLVGEFIAILWTGALVVEVIFQIPGIGLLAFKALINQDTSLVMATFLIPVFLAIFGYLLQDIAYVVLDPRIDYGDR